MKELVIGHGDYVAHPTWHEGKDWEFFVTPFLKEKGFDLSRPIRRIEDIRCKETRFTQEEEVNRICIGSK